MSNTLSLLPCPFCGGDARHDAHADDCYFILHRKFKNSGADMSPAFEVLAAWNRRVAPAAMIGEPVFAFRRKGLDDFYTCTEERYAELSAKPNLFETRIFYTTPPTQAQPVACEPLTCEWAHNEDDGFWDTECGQSWRFDDGGPKENHMNFCHCCGKPLRIKGGQHGADI